MKSKRKNTIATVRTDELMKVSNYAKREGMSLTAIYKMIDAGNIKGIIIDGAAFVLLSAA